MFPTTFVDQVTCLQSLMGIRTLCTVDKEYPFWLEDIEGVDVTKLAKMAKGSNPNGKDFGTQLINTGARQMLGDIETLIRDGYRLNNIAGDMCSTCSLLPSYTVNSGIIVKSTLPSRFQIMRITDLTILTNVTGPKILSLDDGLTVTTYPVELVSGVLIPIKIPYSTSQKTVKIYFTDPTVGLGQISCATPSSCGCGGSQKSNNPINISGMLAGVETTTQYGFLPCASIDCSYDSLVCNLINQMPNIFGLTLYYKVAQLYFDHKNVSDRNNDAVSFNEEDGKDRPKNYGQLYWAKMKGTKDVAGLNKMISDYLKQNRKDSCVLCDSKAITAYVTG